jgi:hypothetical protein
VGAVNVPVAQAEFCRAAARKTWAKPELIQFLAAQSAYKRTSKCFTVTSSRSKVLMVAGEFVAKSRTTT